MGTTLRGKWRLDALLGLGGMAAVYAATHRNGMRGAVKVLDLALSRMDPMRQRFLREGYLANKVDHPGAVRVLDDDLAEDGSAFLVMELLEGKTLDELAHERGGCLPADEVLAHASQVLDALEVAHGLGIVHRDIKPENLLLTQYGLVKVLDFGLARMLEAERTATATQSGTSMGTPAFMSPEQARGRWDLVDARTDLWAVAATMFTLLTGRMVHQEYETPAEMIAATFMQHPQSLRKFMPGATEELISVVDGGLRLERELRWGSAAAMSAAVRVAYHSLTGLEVPLIPSSPPMSGPASSSNPPVSRPSGEAALSFSPTWSQRPRLHSEVAPTVPPPPASKPTRWVLPAAALVVLAGSAVATVAMVHRASKSAAAAVPFVSASETLPPPRPEEPSVIPDARVETRVETPAPPVDTNAAPATTTSTTKKSRPRAGQPARVVDAAKDAGAPATGPNMFDRRF